MNGQRDYHALQASYVKEFMALNDVTSPWLDLYTETYPEAPDDKDLWNACYTYSVLIQKEHVDLLLNAAVWGQDHIANAPSFEVVTDSRGKRMSKSPVDRVIDTLGISHDIDMDIGKRMVVFQHYHNILGKRPPELCEDFRIYHNLWIREDGLIARKINQGDGTDEIVARISPERVQVRTPLVRQYLAGRQLCLLRYADMRALGQLPKDYPIPSSEYPPPRIDLKRSFYHIETSTSYKDSRQFSRYSHGNAHRDELPPDAKLLYSRILGKAIMHPDSVTYSGLYPYYDPFDRTKPGQEYKEYVIGEDQNGEPFKFTCNFTCNRNPDRSAQDIGKNPEPPDYLTPVCFDKKVLEKYDGDARYEVGPNSISCGDIWLLRVDNDNENHVMVWLGDLGNDLPPMEDLHWLQYNIPPPCTGPVSDMAFRRDILAQFASPQSPDNLFYSRYCRLKNEWYKHCGWHLYKQLHDHDNYIKSVRLPRDDKDTQGRDRQISNIQKLLIEYLNIKGIQSAFNNSSHRLDKKPGNGRSIQWLEKWLQAESYSNHERDIKFLRELQKWRSKTNHWKGSSYDELLDKYQYSRDATQVVKEMLKGAITMMDGLIRLAQERADKA